MISYFKVNITYLFFNFKNQFILVNQRKSYFSNKVQFKKIIIVKKFNLYIGYICDYNFKRVVYGMQAQMFSFFVVQHVFHHHGHHFLLSSILRFLKYQNCQRDFDFLHLFLFFLKYGCSYKIIHYFCVSVVVTNY